MKFNTKLSQINRLIEAKQLPTVSRQQCQFLMNRTDKQCANPMVEGLHYTAEKRDKNNVYFFSEDGVKFLEQWAYNRRMKCTQ